MRVTSHNGRTGRNGKAFKVNHNDRKFDTNKANHIDQEKIKDNIEFRNVTVSKEYASLEEYEKGLYKSFFEKFQEAKNARYIKNRHPEKVADVEALYNGKRTCPEETIKEVGKMGETISAAEFEAIMKDYVNRFNRLFGKNVLTLDFVIHLDESTPHAHLRRVYLGHDKEGNLCPNEASAMREMGFERPDLTKEEDRYNSPKMTFTEADRCLFIDVCREHGIEIESDPIHGRKALSLMEYKISKKVEEEKKLDNFIMCKMEQNNILDNVIEKKEEVSKALSEEITEKKGFIKSISEKLEKMTAFKKLFDVARYFKKFHPEQFQAVENEMMGKEDLWEEIER